MLLATVPSGGIAQVTAGSAPNAAGSTATLYRMDPGGTITQLAAVTLYNVSTAEAVPASALATVVQTPGGHYVCLTWAGQVYPYSVLPNDVTNYPGF